MTRADLLAGVQASQTVHAALAFAHEYHVSPDHYLVLLEASDEISLYWILADAQKENLRAVAFYEPDLDDQLTAIALEGAAAQLCRKLPLLHAGGGE